MTGDEPVADEEGIYEDDAGYEPESLWFWHHGQSKLHDQVERSEPWIRANSERTA